MNLGYSVYAIFAIFTLSAFTVSLFNLTKLSLAPVPLPFSFPVDAFSRQWFAILFSIFYTDQTYIIF